LPGRSRGNKAVYPVKDDDRLEAVIVIIAAIIQDTGEVIEIDQP